MDSTELRLSFKDIRTKIRAILLNDYSGVMSDYYLNIIENRYTKLFEYDHEGYRLHSDIKEIQQEFVCAGDPEEAFCNILKCVNIFATIYFSNGGKIYGTIFYLNHDFCRDSIFHRVIYRDPTATNLGEKRFFTFEELPWKEKVHNQFVLANE